jgi:NADP-dependent 3-hydroxy acid dehydrogenase YdfG
MQSPADLSLHGTTALVTGASRGIGAAIAHQLIARGARVALVARTAETLQQRVTELGPNAIAVPCDVADAEAVTRMALSVTRAFGGAPDILVNNAGVFQIAPLAAMSVDLFTDTVRTNLTAPFFVLRAFLPAIHERKTGHIVTIGSVADRMVFPENGAYSPAKYGLRALHEVLRAETRGTGIRATLVSPGSVDTAMWEAVLADQSNSRDRNLPTREVMLSANDVADAVMYAILSPSTVNIDELRLSHS